MLYLASSLDSTIVALCTSIADDWRSSAKPFTSCWTFPLIPDVSTTMRGRLASLSSPRLPKIIFSKASAGDPGSSLNPTRGVLETLLSSSLESFPDLRCSPFAVWMMSTSKAPAFAVVAPFPSSILDVTLEPEIVCWCGPKSKCARSLSDLRGIHLTFWSCYATPLGNPLLCLLILSSSLAHGWYFHHWNPVQLCWFLER